jgi:signal transduction histidine kinase
VRVVAEAPPGGAVVVVGAPPGDAVVVLLADWPARVLLSPRDAEAAVDALIGNVFAHTPEGSGYAVAVRRHDGTVELAVDDAGAGITDPDAALARGVTRAGSTGLGLDIARRSAEAAGGSLAIERSPLGGARVRLILPIDGAAA